MNAEPTPVPPPPETFVHTEIPNSVKAFDDRIIGGKLKQFVDITKAKGFAPQSVIDQVR